MCAGYGYCCCCLRCTYGQRKWDTPYTLETITSFANVTTLSVNVLDSDGSPIKCNGRIAAKDEPCLEIEYAASWNNSPDPVTYASYTSFARFILWFEGWTWTPDGQHHTYKGRSDTSARMIYLRSLNGSVIRDWDYDRDGVPTDPNITFNAADIGGRGGLFMVRQDGVLFSAGFGSQNLEIVEPGFPRPDVNEPGWPPAWNRPVDSLTPLVPYQQRTLWSQPEGGGVDFSNWVQYRDPSDPLYPGNPTFSGCPTNNVGDPEWEIGIGFGVGVSNQNVSSPGTPNWEPAANKFRLDNFCIHVDP